MNNLLEDYLLQIHLEGDVVATAYKDHLHKSKIQCQKLSSDERVKCMVQAKISAKKAQLSKLKQMSPECKKASNPNACQRVLYKRAQTITKSVDGLMARYAAISIKIKNKAAKAQAKQYER